MPFCPECHDEYRAGFTRCVDCGVPLVEHLPELPIPDQSGEPPIAVFETYNQTEADVIRSKLEFFGIPAALRGDLALRNLYNPMGVGTFGLIQILVPGDRAEEARRILEDEIEP